MSKILQKLSNLNFLINKKSFQYLFILIFFFPSDDSFVFYSWPDSWAHVVLFCLLIIFIEACLTVNIKFAPSFFSNNLILSVTLVIIYSILLWCLGYFGSMHKSSMPITSCHLRFALRREYLDQWYHCNNY